MEWVKGDTERSSWHIIQTWTRVPNRALTICGRTINDASSIDVPPANEKTCENCFRLRERTNEPAS